MIIWCSADCVYLSSPPERQADAPPGAELLQAPPPIGWESRWGRAQETPPSVLLQTSFVHWPSRLWACHRNPDSTHPPGLWRSAVGGFPLRKREEKNQLLYIYFFRLSHLSNKIFQSKTVLYARFYDLHVQNKLVLHSRQKFYFTKQIFTFFQSQLFYVLFI